jgi:hypothetical protein
VREVRRAELVAAIGKPCAYCGEPMAAPTRDHIHPRSKGGTLAQGKALVCDPCNGDKGSLMLEAWLHRLCKAGDHRAAFVAAVIERLGTPPAVWSASRVCEPCLQPAADTVSACSISVRPVAAGQVSGGK